MGKVFRTIIMIALAGGLVAGGLYWKNAASEKAEAQQGPAGAKGAGGGKPGGPGGDAPMAMPVVTATVAPQDLTIAITAVGSLIAGESAEIHAEIAGQIEKILFEEGQPVKKGDIILQIDKSLIQTELAKAQAELEATAATFTRDDKLKQSGFVSNQKWDLSKSDMQTSRAAVENARIRLGKASIRAPFDGMAGLRSFSAGDYAQAGQALTTISAIDPLKVEFSIPERNYKDIQTGQKITFAVDSWPDESFEGEIYAIDPRINPDTRNFIAKANIPNPQFRLRPGMYARISVATLTRPNVLMIPEESLLPQGADTFVYTIEDGKVAMKKVMIGTRDAGRVEIISGLATGDEVITAGTMRVGPGMPVISEKAMKEAQQQQAPAAEQVPEAEKAAPAAPAEQPEEAPPVQEKPVE